MCSSFQWNRGFNIYVPRATHWEQMHLSNGYFVRMHSFSPTCASTVPRCTCDWWFLRCRCGCWCGSSAGRWRWHCIRFHFRHSTGKECIVHFTKATGCRKSRNNLMCLFPPDPEYVQRPTDWDAERKRLHLTELFLKYILIHIYILLKCGIKSTKRTRLILWPSGLIMLEPPRSSTSTSRPSPPPRTLHF